MQSINPLDIGLRFRQKRLDHSLSQTQFAHRIGSQQSAVSAIEKGERSPTTEMIVSVINEFGMSADWWLFGREDSTETISEPQEKYSVSMPVRAMAGAGSPCCIDQMEPIGHITIDKSYNGPNIQVIKIRGSSMEPTVMDGGYVGVDINSKEIVSGQMYAVYIPHEGVVVKRIWIGPELVKIASDNPAAPDHEIMTDRVNWDSFVQGRVKWVLQAYYGE